MVAIVVVVAVAVAVAVAIPGACVAPSGREHPAVQEASRYSDRGAAHRWTAVLRGRGRRGRTGRPHRRAPGDPTQHFLGRGVGGEMMVGAPLRATREPTKFATPRTATNGIPKAAHAVATPAASRRSTCAPVARAIRLATVSSTVIPSVVATSVARMPFATKASTRRLRPSSPYGMGSGNWAAPSSAEGSTRRTWRETQASPIANAGPGALALRERIGSARVPRATTTLGRTSRMWRAAWAAAAASRCRTRGRPRERRPPSHRRYRTPQPQPKPREHERGASSGPNAARRRREWPLYGPTQAFVKRALISR